MAREMRRAWQGGCKTDCGGGLIEGNGRNWIVSTDSPHTWRSSALVAFFVQRRGNYRAVFLSRDWKLGLAPGRTNFDAGSTGSLTHYLPRQGKNPACTQNGLAIRHADPLREYQRTRAAQQHGFTLQPGTKQGRRKVIRIQAYGGEETRHPGQIEATNPERQIGKSRQHATMGHVLAVAVALFNTEPEGKRPVISADHDGADGFQKRASGGAGHEAFRDGGGGRVIQGRATFRLN